jgi:ribonuclease E
LGGLIVIDFIDMESTKNQREVENRLRDALHHDRARVQMGKISRFGLMELSRQRLRPALAETSYITCPRCTGTGHIRSTESAALHILRILEEEAMKDNTAAVHTQVPIDVATFLLNEKRPDIAAIELRHKVSILLIPNTHLETPQHSIVRLRHDELNQEDLQQPSYKMVEAPVDEAKQATAQADSRQPRQQAAVKLVTPDQPAPMVEEKAATPPTASTAQETGIIAKIFSWFRGNRVAEPVPEPVKKAPSKPAERSRNRQRDESRGGSRDEQREGSRRGRGGRNGRKDEERPENEGREGREPRQPREPREPREPRQQNAARDEAQTTREPRRQRGEPRPERTEITGQPQDTKQTSAISVADAATPDAAGEESRGRRRGRRGGRRERGEGRPEQQAETNNTQEVVANAEVVPASVVDVVEIAPIAIATPVMTETVLTTAEILPVAITTPLQPETALPQEISAVETRTEPVVVEASVAPVVIEVPVTAVSTAVEAIASPEPVVTSAAISIPAKPVEDKADLGEVLQASGLVMVETAAEKVRSLAIEIDATPDQPPPPRRRRPATVVVSDEPMVIIETRK